MTTYKRNQITDAICQTVDDGETHRAELELRIKRLFETDRGLGRNKKSKQVQQTRYAFFSEEPPGKGFEAWFSEVEGFAVLTAIRLMAHGWTQRFAVWIVRFLRDDLERQYGRFICQDPRELFDEDKIRRTSRPGDLYVDNTDPVFLVLASGINAMSKADAMPACAICRGLPETWAFIHSGPKGSWTFLELVTPGHRFHDHLIKTMPRKRGRS